MTLAKIPLAGVIGHPIAHSRSPLLHGHWLRSFGLAGHYVPMDVSPEDLRDALRTLPRVGFVGANVTLPHKENALEIADIVTDTARRIGAANTLTFLEDGKILADNTDGYGFMQNLKQGAPKWQADAGASVILGAGGAARAVIVALLDEGVSEILISNRTAERAEQLCQEFGSCLRMIEWAQASDAIKAGSTIINTTSLGMAGKPELNLSLEGLQKEATVTDLVYNPLKTKLLEAADDAGCVTVDGLGMLLHQAVPGFERWFGIRPNVDDATRKAALA